ncbi:hypothetical protein QQ045_031064 [Rhodiola kirilowii]
MLINCMARPDPHRAMITSSAISSKHHQEYHQYAENKDQLDIDDQCEEAVKARKGEEQSGQEEEKIMDDDECLMKRSLLAHLDYIYTQNHTKSP